MSRFRTLLSTLSLFASASAYAAPDLQISDLLGNSIESVLPAGASFGFSGSIVSLEQLKKGEPRLVIAAIPDGQALPEDMICIPFAFDVVSVVVNNSNPLKEIHVAQLARIYSASSDSADKWGQVGLADAWKERRISACLPPQSEWVTMQIFDKNIMGGAALREGLTIIPTRAVLEQTVREQSQSIVIMRGVNIPDGGKTLAITRGSGADAYSYQPTESGIFFGDYFLRLPFYIVLRKDASEQTRALAAELLSDNVAAALAKAGFVPAPKSERAPELYLAK